MRSYLSLILASFILLSCNKEPRSPKLVVAIVVDQMKYDYLDRFKDQWSDNGYNRFLNEGYSFDNCNYSYIPTFTGPGHATIFTGRYPSNSGIIANDWYDRDSNRTIYCVEDYSVQPVGSDKRKESRSPFNLKVNSISDHLLAKNSQSKTFSVSLKDRGAVTPGRSNEQECVLDGRQRRLYFKYTLHAKLTEMGRGF